MMKATRLQIPTLSCLKLNSHFPRQRTPQAKPVVPHQTLPHSNTGHLLVIPVMPVVPTVPVASTSVPQYETRGPLMAHPHPHSHWVSYLPARAPALFLAAPVGQSSYHPHYATSYNYPESPSLGFMDMGLESEAQLLNALPPPIRRHQRQRYTFGTGIVDTRGQIDVGQGASTLFQYQQQAMPVYPEYSFEGDSTYVSDSAQPHRYYQHKPAPAPHRYLEAHCSPWNPIQTLRFLGLSISTWEHNNGHNPLCNKRRHSSGL